jgi:hypothetical protein
MLESSFAFSFLLKKKRNERKKTKNSFISEMVGFG